MAGLVVIVGLLATFPIPKSEQQIITNETIKEIQQNIWDNKKILADVSYFEKNNKIELENVQILWIDYDSLYIELKSDRFGMETQFQYHKLSMKIAIVKIRPIWYGN